MADVERERVTALWREAAAAVETPRCTCTEDESSDGSATYEDDPHCPTHGWCSWRAECRRLREQLDAARRALEFYADPLTYFAIGIFPDHPAGEFMDDFSEVPWPDGGTNVKPGKRARAALGVEGRDE